MTAVTIIGPGSIGSAVAGLAQRAGASIQVLARDRDKADGLANEVGGSAGSVGDPLMGEVAVLAVPPDSSAAAQLQDALPRAYVVKAFNTTFASAIASGRTGESATTVLVAGDDEAARNRVVELVTTGGLAAVSAGGLKRARELEAPAFLQMTLAAQEVVSWGGGFSLQK